jgi:hypothetical protein
MGTEPCGTQRIVSTLNERQAFDAMRYFLERYWERGGRSSDDLAVLLGELSTDVFTDDAPSDPAQWHDWLVAVAAVT